MRALTAHRVPVTSRWLRTLLRIPPIRRAFVAHVQTVATVCYDLGRQAADQAGYARGVDDERRAWRTASRCN